MLYATIRFYDFNMLTLWDFLTLFYVGEGIFAPSQVFCDKSL